jgi:hypothetical protein
MLGEMTHDLEKLLSPRCLIPAGALVPASGLIPARPVVAAEPPVPSAHLVPPLQLVPVLLLRQDAAPRCSNDASCLVGRPAQARGTGREDGPNLVATPVE